MNKAAFVQISSDGLIAKEDKSDVWYRQKSVRGEPLFPLFSNCMGYAFVPVPSVGAVVEFALSRSDWLKGATAFALY